MNKTDPVLEAIKDQKKRESLTRRMSSKVAITTSNQDCWLWTAQATCNGGYGAINAGRGPKLRAHRVAWALAGNDLPSGLVLCHKCDTPKCCNPNHMFLGTKKDNTQDMIRKNRNSKPPVSLGERHHKATIADKEIETIRASKDKLRVLAEAYGVSVKTIFRIRKGKTRCAPVI